MSPLPNLTPDEAEALAGLLLERFVVPDGFTGSKQFHFKGGRFQVVADASSKTRRQIDDMVEQGRLDELLSSLTGEPAG